MDYIKLIEKRKALAEELRTLQDAFTLAETENRQLSEIDNNRIESLTNEIRNLETEIEQVNNKNNNKNNKRNMENFGELITRSANGRIEDFNVRALTLATTAIQNTTTSGDVAVVGYEPFYKQMGVTVMPNLANNIQLPYINAMIAGKAASGAVVTNGESLSSITLAPQRFTITETVDITLQSVANQDALQSFIFEMVKACDRSIQQEIYNVSVAGASAVTGLTGYTTLNFDNVVGGVDGEVAVLLPRAEFYKAKAVKASENGVYLANKVNAYSGNLWDGTPLFYSQLFTGNTTVAVDLKYVVVGEFGNEYKVSFLEIPSKGQVEITVCKLADVKLRSALAAKKAVIA